MSCAVIRSNSDSAGLAVDPADSTNSTAVAISVSDLVPDLVDNLPSLALLTGAVLYSFNRGSSAHLLLIYLFYFSNLLFLAKTVLAFLIYLAVL